MPNIITIINFIYKTYTEDCSFSVKCIRKGGEQNALEPGVGCAIIITVEVMFVLLLLIGVPAIAFWVTCPSIKCISTNTYNGLQHIWTTFATFVNRQYPVSDYSNRNTLRDPIAPNEDDATNKDDGQEEQPEQALIKKDTTINIDS